MTKPLFKNERPYSVSVPTPYGSSINVPTGKYVAGTYFNRFYASNRELKLMPEGSTVPANQIICSYDVVLPNAPTVQLPTIVNSAEVITIESVPSVSEPSRVDESIDEPKKNKGGRPRKSIAEAANEMWKDVTFVLPSASEVDTLSNEKLSSLAQKLEVSKGLPRTEMIQNIKLKLG